MKTSIAGLGILLWSASLAAAAAPDLTLDNIKFSDSAIVGDKVSGDALKGRVVLLEFWGIN